MALPATLRVLGLPLGLAVIVLMGLLSEASIEMMLRTSTARQAWSYSELVGGGYGRGARLALQLSILVNNVGICIVYLIIVADVLSGTAGGGAAAGHHSGLLEEWAGGGRWWTGRAFVLLVTTATVLVPLVAQRHVDSLKYTSAVAIALAVLFVVITFSIAAVKLAEGKIGAPAMLPRVASSADILQLCSIIPVMSNAFICHFNVHPIYVELRERTEASMARVARVSLAVCTAVYVLTSLSGYLLFGAATAADVLSNFDADLGVPYSGLLDGIVRAGYAVHVLLVFPLIHFALRQNVDELLFPAAAVPLGDSRWRFAGITAGLMALVLLGAVLVPDIWVAFQFTGATSAVSIGFIFPALMALEDKTGVIAGWEKRVARALLILAVIVSVTGIVSSTFDTIESAYSTDP